MSDTDKKIKQALISRWEELGLFSYGDSGRMSFAPIVADAQEKAPDMKITADRLSKYLSGFEQKRGKKFTTSWLSDTQVGWLCVRWFVPVETIIGLPTKKVNYVIPEYNEAKALKELAKKFPQ